MKAYASKAALKQECVDPRFNLVTRGTATTIDALEGKWATGKGYGKKVTTIYSKILAIQTGSTDTGNKNDGDTKQTIYRVQVGAYNKKENAFACEQELLSHGFETCIAKDDGFYKVQVGAFSKKKNAEAKLSELKKAGYNGFITTAENRTDSGSINYQPTKKLNYTSGNYLILANSLNVRTGPSTDYPVKDFSELTASAQRQGGYKKNVVFTALEIVNSEKSAWAKTPSGWVCLELNGKIYVQKA